MALKILYSSVVAVQLTNKTVHLYKNKFIVPTYFFSAALMKYKVKGQGDWQYKAIAFWFKHENNNGTSLKPYVISIKELEAKTGIDFFCNLPDNIERDVESKTPYQMILTGI